jgi:hypothetical protein
MSTPPIPGAGTGAPAVGKNIDGIDDVDDIATAAKSCRYPRLSIAPRTVASTAPSLQV